MLSSSSIQGILLLAAHLIGLVAAQSLNASDSAQSPFPTGDDQLQLSPPLGYPGSSNDTPPRINLVNLTSAAVTKLSADQGSDIVIRENIVFIPPNSSYSISKFSSSAIAIIPCDTAPGFQQPLQAVQYAISRSTPAIVLYSTTHDICNLQTGGNIPSGYVIYSTNDPTAWATIQQLQSQSFGGPYPPQWLIGRKIVLDNATMSNNGNNGGSGSYGFGGSNGSPSTAVAMIILYSITGVITALFLVIIITGAIRAHRHPERYGPRNVLGRPRQSRAKGLARAMLDTLPIVKFGEREGDRPKPTDVELANTESGTSAQGGDTNAQTQTQKAALSTTSETEATAGAEDTSSRDITVAAPLASKDTSAEAPKEEDVLGCSICTEDFERGQDVRVLPCNHSYHPACIDPWLLNVSGTCPLCRIDLRPANEQDGDNSHNRASAEAPLPPPLDAEGAEASGLHPPNNRASRRLSGFITDILNPNRMQSASREERIAALRRFTEHRRQSGNEEAETRRRRRLTARLGETFGVRTRPRGTSPPAATSASAPSLSPRDTQPGAARSIAEESIREEEQPATTTAAPSQHASDTSNPTTSGAH